MASTYSAPIQGAQTGTRQRFGFSLSKFVADTTARWQRRRTLRQLAAMDDRLLNDMGLDRAELLQELGYDPRTVAQHYDALALQTSRPRS